jgi:transposase
LSGIPDVSVDVGSEQLRQEVIPVKTKRTYRAKDVNEVRISKVVAGRQGQEATVGIDVGKNELFLMLRWKENVRFEGPWRAKNITQIREVVELLMTLSNRCRLVVAMEPTGTYGDPLRYALTQAGLTVHRVQGKIAHDYAEVFDGVPSQHDRKDAAVVAELAAIGKSMPWPYEVERPADQERTYQVERLDAVQQTKQVWCGRLEGRLARYWPEVTKLLPLSSACLLKLLEHYGSPAALAAATDARKRMASWGRAFLTEEKISAVLTSAQETVGVPIGEFERQWLQECARELLAACRQKRQINRELARLVRENAGLALQADAIGAAMASVLWVHLGSPRAYASAAAYRKAMGLNLKERSSGRYKGQLKITKRGSGAVRRWLYMAAVRLLQDPQVRVWYEAKKARDGGRVGRALVAVMRKLAGALYRVAVDEVPFETGKLFPGKPLQKKTKGISARARQKELEICS